MQVPSACFIQPPLSFVGLTEEQCKEQLTGEVDVFVSKFKPMKNVLSGRDEKTLMKLLVEVSTDKASSWLTCSHALLLCRTLACLLAICACLSQSLA